MSGLPPEHLEMLTSAVGPDTTERLRQFLDTPDMESAERLAEAHPELHDLHIVVVLVNAASQSTAAAPLLDRAVLLCGPGWDGGPQIVMALGLMMDVITLLPFEPSVVDEAVAVVGAVAEAYNDGVIHPVLVPHLLGLASSLLARIAEETGEPALLDDAIDLGGQAAVTATPGTEAHIGYSSNLAHRYAEKFDLTGDPAALFGAISVYRRMLEAIPPGHPDRAALRIELASTLAALYHIDDELPFLEEAIVELRAVVATLTGDDPVLPAALHMLADALGHWHGATDEVDALLEAVGLGQRAVEATPAIDPELSVRLADVARHLYSLFRARGDIEVFRQAVLWQRRAVDAAGPDAPELAGHLDQLGRLLLLLHSFTPERDLLDQCIDAHRQAVAVTADDDPDRPSYISNLGGALAALGEATGDVRFVAEAVDLQREVVDATPPSSPVLAVRLDDLGSRLADLFGRTSVPVLLDEAVAVQRRALAAVSPDDRDILPVVLTNLANHVARLGKPDLRTAVQEAIEHQRRALDLIPESDNDRPSLLTNLANRLADLHEATGETRPLDEAWRALEGLTTTGPDQTSRAALARGRLARLDHRGADRFSEAARHVLDAIDAYSPVLASAGPRDVARRDVAQHLDGLIGEAATAYALGEEAAAAAEVVETRRIWLPPPPIGDTSDESSSSTDRLAVPVVWVVTSQTETAVIATDDQRSFTSTVVPVTAEDLRSSVHELLNLARLATVLPLGEPSAGEVLAARRRAVDRLCAVAGEITAVFPPSERLLIIPVGDCAILPYAAAPSGSGRLIDKSTITVAPTLAWARAAHRLRPDGPSVGAFHPGDPSAHRLDLDADREAFRQLVGGAALDEPTAEELLAQLRPGTDIGHLSCHGQHDVYVPLDSYLQLGTPLTIRAVLDHPCAPWLVNLSACETGVPDTQAPDEMISFPTAFLLGGAAHVLATLWPVGNPHATAVNRDVYEQLAASAHPADALRHAVQRLRGAIPGRSAVRAPTAAADQTLETVDDPFWWAPFTHYGSPW